MSENQATPGTVAIRVSDRPELSFRFDVATLQTSDIGENPTDCTVTLLSDAFDRLMANETTFEIEVNNGALVIAGNAQLLNQLGKFFQGQSF